jgi:hypothetical protein
MTSGDRKTPPRVGHPPPPRYALAVGVRQSATLASPSPVNGGDYVLHEPTAIPYYGEGID